MVRISKISCLILSLFLLHCEISSSQQTSIKGVITDSTALPIEKVIIIIPGTSAGTYTDKSGAFSLNIPEDSNEYIIVFSHIGFLTERRKIKCDRSEIIINLTMPEDVTRIGEVTVNSPATFSFR
jgi:hypothetical protein